MGDLWRGCEVTVFNPTVDLSRIVEQAEKEERNSDILIGKHWSYHECSTSVGLLCRRRTPYIETGFMVSRSVLSMKTLSVWALALDEAPADDEIPF